MNGIDAEFNQELISDVKQTKKKQTRLRVDREQELLVKERISPCGKGNNRDEERGRVASTR